MTEIIEFPEPELEELSLDEYQKAECAKCGSLTFRLLHDGEISDDGSVKADPTEIYLHCLKCDMCYLLWDNTPLESA